VGSKIGGVITRFVSLVLKRVWSRMLVVVVLTALAVITARGLLPEAEYLPEGNRNFVYAFLVPPPGYNNAQLEQVVAGVAEDMRPYWETEPGSPEAEKLVGPTIEDFFYIASPTFGVLIGTHKLGGAVAIQLAGVDTRVRRVVTVAAFASMQEIVAPLVHSGWGEWSRIIPEPVTNLMVVRAGARGWLWRQAWQPLTRAANLAFLRAEAESTAHRNGHSVRFEVEDHPGAPDPLPPLRTQVGTASAS